MTTLNEYLNRNLTEDEKKTQPLESLEDAKKAYPELKVWVETDDELLAIMAKGKGDEG